MAPRLFPAARLQAERLKSGVFHAGIFRMALFSSGLFPSGARFVHGRIRTRTSRALPGVLCAALALAACDPVGGRDTLSSGQRGPFAPEVDRRGETVDQLVVGHRLLAAGEAELALDAFRRAAAERGLEDAEVLSSLGTANLALGRLGQAESLLRRAVEQPDAWAEIHNNLGVVLMERGKTAEAEQVLRRAFALSNGENDSIRDNLRLALAKLDGLDYTPEGEQDYKLVRRGTADYLIRTTP